jgi:CBS domain-containing protein
VKISDVMRRRVPTCRPETNLAEATALMWENDCGVLPVVTETGQLVGLVTDRDMCIALGTRNVQASDILVRDIIGERVLVCSPSEDIQVASGG